MPLSRSDREFLPLGLAQKSVWFDISLAGTSGYLLGGWVRTEQAIDRTALRASLELLVQNHAALRLRVDDRQPRQWIEADADLPLEFVTLASTHDATHADQQFQDLLSERFSTPIPFGDGPLFRILVAQCGNFSYITWCFHHIVADSATVSLALDHWFAAYQKIVGQRDEPLVQTTLFEALDADERYAASDAFTRDLKYWRKRFASAPPALIDVDVPRASTRALARTATRTLPQSADFAAATEQLGMPLPRALFGLFLIALARRYARSDVVCGLALHRRNSANMRTLGMFAGVIPVRVEFEDWWSVGDCLQAFNEQIDADLKHHRLPLDALGRELGDAAPAGGRFFDVVMSYIPGAARKRHTEEDVVTGVVDSRERCPISLHATDDPDSGELRYRIAINPDFDDVLDPTTLADLLQETIAAFVADEWLDAGSLPSIASSERARLEDLEHTEQPFEGERIEASFAHQAQRTPDAIALVDTDNSTLSYAQLDAASAQLAAHLGAIGVTPGAVVGVRMPRSSATVIALLGILRAGAVYLPLDPDYPDERLEYIANDAGAVCILDTRPDIDSAAPATALRTQDDIHADAYICYTSGTSGRPKGVAVSHLALQTLAHARATGHCQTGPGDRVLAGISVGFDVSIEQLLVPLLSGATVVIAPDLKLLGPERFWSLLHEQRITHFNSVPSFIAAMLAAGITEQGRETLALRALLLGGEALSGSLAERIGRFLPDTTLINVYGPTEACIEATAFTSTPSEYDLVSLPIGRPLANYIATVRNPELQRVGQGVAGELLLGGPSLASRYVNLPEQTAESFVDDPDAPGTRLYRTGDRVRWRTDGELEFLGRVDDQVKIRGFRVEPAEISERLARHNGVNEAAVIARSQSGAAGAANDLALYAYFTGDAQVDVLLEALRRALPAYMIPISITLLDALPLTVNGKLDRRALPAVTAEAATAQYAPAASDTEQQVIDAITAVLTDERNQPPTHPIGRHDSFFALGGHSLSAVRVVARLEAATGRALPLRALFDAHTVADLAHALDTLEHSDLALPPIAPAPRDQVLPLSFSQERLWFVERFAEPGAIAETMAFDLRGTLDTDRLRRVFAALFARHEGLRLRVEVHAGAPVQTFAAADALLFSVHDLADTDARTQTAAIERCRRAPVDPTVSAFRIDLFDLGTNEGERAHVLAMSLHHMVYDGVSLAVMLAEFNVLWASDGDPTELPPRTLTYADFAAWQRDALSGGRLKAGLERTVARLTRPPPPLALPADRPRPEQPTHRAARLPIIVPAEPLTALRALAAAHNASLFMVLQTALAVLLAREARVDDLIIGTVAAGRAHTELQGAIGPFFNMVALRHQLDFQAPFTDALDEARNQALAAFDDQLVPFEVIIEQVVEQRDARHAVSPLFQVLFQLHNEAGTLLEPIGTGGLNARPLDWSKPQAMQDLTFDLFEHEQTLEGTVTYATELFDAQRIERLIARYVHLLGAIAAAPSTPVGALGLLPPGQVSMLDSFTQVPRALPARAQRTVPAQLLEHAARTPLAPALAEADAPFIDYATLMANATRLARQLDALGTAPGQVIAVATEPLGATRDTALITALLAVWDCRATYLPINVDDPVARLQQILDDADVQRIIAPSDLAPHLSALTVPVLHPDAPEMAAAIAAKDATPMARATADDRAYLIYTSGSSGKPKGVGVSHGALAAFCAAIACDLEPHLPGDDFPCVLSAAAPVFDAFFMDLAMSLVRGAPMVRLSPRRLAEPGYLDRAATVHNGGYLDLTPSVWRAALASGWQPGPHFQCVTGGEAIEPDLAAAITANGAPLYNSYGPTEATVVAVAGPITAMDQQAAQRGTPLPIGRPLPGSQAYVLDPALKPVAPGVPGELVLGGAQIALGYLGQPELTAESFVADPFSGAPGQRLYRTGDLARWRDDGQLEFLGRIDAQVKIRGMRVELGEIETGLLTLPDVTAAAAATTDTGGRTALVGYLVIGPADDDDAPLHLRDDARLDTAALRIALAQRLPEHMIPVALVALNRLPLTVNGKLDRRALPAVNAEATTAQYAPAASDTEQQVIDAITTVLTVERGQAPVHSVGRHDNFFALGGHSLSAVRLVACLEAATGRALPLRALFDAGTVADLADALDTVEHSADDLPPNAPAPRDEVMPRTAPTPKQAQTQTRLANPRAATHSEVPSPECEITNGVRTLRWRGASYAPGTLVLLHGLGDSADTWRPVMSAWRERALPAIALDFPGHGGTSPLDPQDYTVPALARWTASVLAAQRLPAPIFIGHSLGARVALELACNNTLRTSKLVVVDVNPEPEDAVGGLLDQHLDELASGAHSLPLFVDQMAQRLPLANREVLTSVLRDQIAATRQPGDTGVRVRLDPAVKRLLRGAAQSDGWALLDNMQCPGAIVRGGFSGVLDEPTARRMARSIRAGGTFHTVSQAGHAIALEQPAELAQVLSAVVGRPST